jgi:imidazolonepropionase-like amidohydrolase
LPYCFDDEDGTMSSSPPLPTSTLFREVRVFDGTSGVVSGPSDVFVEGNLISAVTPAGRDLSVAERTLVVDGRGRVLMPGLIDAHWHSAFAALAMVDALTADSGYVQLLAGRTATETLLRGFTTVRDAGGPTFGLKRAIDSGVLVGPRIYPSGAFISQSGGHGDFRLPYEVPRGVHGHICHVELTGGAAIADGVDEVLRAAREQLMLGASQLKVMAGGGVSSHYDPLDVTQYTEPELRAAVDAAENWGTYVMVHAYTPRAVQQAIRAGVKCIDHGHLLDEATVELMAENETWWSLQPFLDDEDAIPETGANLVKQQHLFSGTDRAYELGKQYGIRIAWGTDTLFDAELAGRQGRQLTKMVRWFTPGEVLTMATSTNADLLALSGQRNPYPGRIGVVAEGAYADLLLVDGDPVQDIDLLARPDESLLVIMKDGVVVKDLVTGTPSHRY